MKKIVFFPAMLLFSTAAAAADFTGPRVEARVGWDSGELSSEFLGERFALDGDGVAYGLELGYDQGFGGAVIGAYGGFELSSTKLCIREEDEEFCAKMRRNFTAGVRAGALVSPPVLLYAKGGYSNGRIGLDDEFEDEDEVSGRSRGGFHLGAGFEYSGGPTYLRGEYVFTRYNSFRDEDEGTDARFRRHQVMVSVGYRF
jgi:outer membrane immunogenic protein